MAVELRVLYEQMRTEYDVVLRTTSCFGKMVGWMHMVEEPEFSSLLRGDELVFNTGLNYASEAWLKELVDSINRVHARGLIVALQHGRTFSKDIINYCNQIQLPLFSATWETPFVDIMRKFSEILIQNEQNETSLVAALKHAIYYPEDEDQYLNHFEMNGFFRDMSYAVAILSCFTYDAQNRNRKLAQLHDTVRKVIRKSALYEEKGRLIILTAGYLMDRLKSEFQKICSDDPNVYIGIGTVEKQIQDIHRSYKNAYTAYELTKTTIPKNLLCYDELGVYKILADMRNAEIYPNFVEEVLGNLIRYDQKNGTDYVKILNCFFDHDCSILNTSKALYCHKNTLSYKMNAIKDILGYDIMCNENRVKIMVAYYILRLGEDYYHKGNSQTAILSGSAARL